MPWGQIGAVLAALVIVFAAGKLSGLSDGCRH